MSVNLLANTRGTENNVLTTLIQTNQQKRKKFNSNFSANNAVFFVFFFGKYDMKIIGIFLQAINLVL